MTSPLRRIVFQGDSITDCQRQKDDPNQIPPEDLGRHLGCGYALMIAGRLLAERRPDLDIRNFGISGNRVCDLYARIRENGWNQQPDLLSILIGVNDTWHEGTRQAGVPVERYARIYRMLLEETRAALPHCRLVLCEPFILPCGVTEGWRGEIDERRAAVRELATDFAAILVPFQIAFDAALERAPASHWAGDGVHPTSAGHHLMANTWLEACAELLT